VERKEIGIMLYVYCEKPSLSVVELVKALEGKRLKQFDGMDFWDKGKRVKLEEGDIIVCWGSHVPEIEGMRVLNGRGVRLDAKLVWRILTDWTIPCSRRYEKNPRDSRFLGRTNGHKNGGDLLEPPAQPDYWEERLNLIHEYRVHSFDKRSIRAGIKRPREGFVGVHPWIRTWDCGWKVDYGEFESTKELRGLAHKVVGVLGLTFGAVDVGELANGSRIVLGVETGPILTEVTEGPYVKAIAKWIANVRDEKPKSVGDPDDPVLVMMSRLETPYKDPFEEMDKLGPPRPRTSRTGERGPDPTGGTGGYYTTASQPQPVFTSRNVRPTSSRGLTFSQIIETDDGLSSRPRVNVAVAQPPRPPTPRNQSRDQFLDDALRSWRVTANVSPESPPEPPSESQFITYNPTPEQRVYYEAVNQGTVTIPPPPQNEADPFILFDDYGVNNEGRDNP